MSLDSLPNANSFTLGNGNPPHQAYPSLDQLSLDSHSGASSPTHSASASGTSTPLKARHPPHHVHLGPSPLHQSSLAGDASTSTAIVNASASALTGGRTYPPLPSLIANYGDAGNTSWLDDRYLVWRDLKTGAAIGQVPSY